MSNDIASVVLQQMHSDFKMVQPKHLAFALSHATMQRARENGYSFDPGVEVWLDDLIPYGKVVTGPSEWIEVIFAARHAWLHKNMLAERAEDKPDPAQLATINGHIQKILEFLVTQEDKEGPNHG